jgi:threonine/homoserine/homoserine lactone efflux protein
VIQVAGGLAMLAIAVRLARGGGTAGAAPSRFGPAFRISFAATLANPATIVSWVGAFAAAVPALNLTKMETATALPAGVVVGSAAWFIGLSTASALAGKRMNETALRVLSYVGACAIGGFGVLAVLSGVGGV